MTTRTMHFSAKTFLMRASLACLSLLATNAYSQKGYLKLQTGYQFSLNPLDAYSGVSNTTAANVNTTTQTYTPMKMGSGVNVGAAFGYQLSSRISAELGVHYLLGAKSQTSFESTNLGFGNNSSKDENEMFARMLFINPSIVFHGAPAKLSPYARFGLIMGSGYIVSENTSRNTNNSGTTNEYTKVKVNGNLAWGASGAVGVNYQLQTKISVYGELAINAINYQPQRVEITEATLNGNDVLNTLSTRDKITEFVDEYTYSNNNSNENEADKSSTVNIPFSNIALQLGIRFAF